jgi:serine/threonine protein phosphatase 1
VASLNFLISLQTQHPNLIVCLAGNHEELALDAFSTGQNENWFRNGGGKTLRSCGVGSVADLPPHHIDWLNCLIDQHDDGRRQYDHAGIDPWRPLDQQDDHDLRWIRDLSCLMIATTAVSSFTATRLSEHALPTNVSTE